MLRHILQCLLVSMVYYVPGAWSRSYVSMSEPMARCSLDEVVNRLTLEDLARLVTRWGLREGLSPVRVLHRIENGITTSSTVHVPFLPELSRPGGSETDTDSDFPPTTPIRMPSHTPSLTGGQQVVSRPPGNNSPLPPPSINIPADFGQLPPFGPPMGTLHFPGHRQQQMPSPLMPIGTLRPPPDAIVRIVDNVFGTSVPAVSVTISPRMPITEALLQAAAEFDTSNSPSEFNYYRIVWGRNGQLRCFVIRTVGNLSSTGGYVWEVIVTERNGKEIWRSICLPTLPEVHVKPGMTITLNYIKQEDI